MVLWPFGGILGLLEAFYWDFQGFFKGNMVGKWTNEPCSRVDEVVNHFWVLTSMQLIKHSAFFLHSNYLRFWLVHYTHG